MRKTALSILLLALILTACGQPETGAGRQTTEPATPQPQSTQAPTSAPTSPPATSTAEPATTVPATIAPATAKPTSGAQPADTLVQQARAQLARHLGVGADTLTLKDAQAQEWPNSALGCPKPDEAYSEVVTPGFLLNFVGGGKTYPVHTDQSGARLVLCENAQPTDLSTDAVEDSTAMPLPPAPVTPATPKTNPPAPPMAQAAQASLAKDLGISADNVTIVSVEAVEWNDSSLGCPKEGVNYLQVITPGYRVILEAQGQRYEYHTDQQRSVVRCSIMR